MFLVVGAPALAASADQRGHGRVDDHVGWDVQVGDPFVGIHHIHRRACIHRVFDGLGDLGVVLDPLHHVADACVRVHTRRFQLVTVFVKDGLQVFPHRVAKDDWVRHFHHRRFHVQREQRAVFLGLFDLLGQEFVQRLGRHEGGVDHSARGERNAILQHGLGPVGGNMHDLGRTGLRLGQRQGFLVREEITARHGRYFGFAVLGPCAHRMGVRHRVFLDRIGRATVRVAFAQNGVHRRALDRVIGRAGFLFRVGAWRFGIVGQRIALTLQFLDRGDQLRHRGRDIRQVDHIGVGRFHQIAQDRQIVGLFLRLGQRVGEGRQNTPRQRDITGAHRNPCRIGKAADDRQQRIACQFGGLIDLRVNDVGCLCLSHGIQPFLKFGMR